MRLPGFYQLYYQLKYLPLLLWRRPPMERKGFVGIQVDGLAYDYLVHAVEQGRVPRVKRWLDTRQFKLAAYPAGLPSCTSYAQVGMFYGANDDIPAFRWYEKADRRVVNCNRPHSVDYVRRRLGDRKGVLRGGSSYANLVDGDASRSAWTANSSVPRSFFEDLGGFRFFLLVLLHPVRVVMTVLASVREVLLELYDRYWARGNQRHTVGEGWFLIVRVLSNVVLRELQTVAVMADVYAGVPCIFTTFASYDELAHHYGPRSRPALKNLNYVFGRIAEIEKIVRRMPGRHYDLIVLSDHGQTGGTPFLRLFGATLGEVLHRHLEDRRVHVHTGGTEPTSVRIRGLVAERIGRKAERRGRLVGSALRWVARRIAGVADVEAYLPEKYYVDEDNDIVVTYSGTLALVYFARWPERLDDEAVRREFPEVLDFLVGHAGVGLVATQAKGEGVMLRSARGVSRLAGGEVTVLEGDDPLAPYEAGPIARRALERMVLFGNAGDLVLFGRYEDGQIVCFDDQVASHGCLGGPQFWPFLLVPNDPRFDQLAITDPRDLYGQLFEPYHVGEPESGGGGKT